MPIPCLDASFNAFAIFSSISGGIVVRLPGLPGFLNFFFMVSCKVDLFTLIISAAFLRPQFVHHAVLYKPFGLVRQILPWHSFQKNCLLRASDNTLPLQQTLSVPSGASGRPIGCELPKLASYGKIGTEFKGIKTCFICKKSNYQKYSYNLRRSVKHLKECKSTLYKLYIYGLHAGPWEGATGFQYVVCGKGAWQS